MKRFYLIRHGKTSRDCKSGHCLSRTDFPLDAVGQEQAAALGQWVQLHPSDVVYTSPALRCQQTAAAISNDAQIRSDLWEMNVGEWENLTFDEIRAHWPQEYEARGTHIGTIPPPGGESFYQAGQRLESFLNEILRSNYKSAVIVAHSGLFRGWLWKPLALCVDDVLKIRQPLGGITTIEIHEGRFIVTELGVRPGTPGPVQIQNLWDRCATPESVRAHCKEVAKTACLLAERCSCIDKDLLRAACLLHDLYRPQGNRHPASAAQLLAEEGWPALADTVARHHDLGTNASTEAELLYLADKLTDGVKHVAWQDRFQHSRQRCQTPDAQRAWKKRYDDTSRLAKKYGVGTLLSK